MGYTESQSVCYQKIKASAQGNVSEATRRHRIGPERPITVLHLSRNSQHSHKCNEVF
jgi:hypothetical protein